MTEEVLKVERAIVALLANDHLVHPATALPLLMRVTAAIISETQPDPEHVARMFGVALVDLVKPVERTIQ